MLGALPIDSDKTKWITKINESRVKYEELRNKVINHYNPYIFYHISSFKELLLNLFFKFIVLQSF